MAGRWKEGRSCCSEKFSFIAELVKEAGWFLGCVWERRGLEVATKAELMTMWQTLYDQNEITSGLGYLITHTHIK